jgi:hypothetical protein
LYVVTPLSLISPPADVYGKLKTLSQVKENHPKPEEEEESPLPDEHEEPATEE